MHERGRPGSIRGGSGTPVKRLDAEGRIMQGSQGDARMGTGCILLTHSWLLSNSSPCRLAIRYRVRRLTPKSMAACLLLPAVFSRASWRWRFSISSRDGKASDVGASSCSLVGRSSTRRMGLAVRATARSMTCSNSRTFPGQSYWHRWAMASGAIWLSLLPASEAYFPRKCKANNGIS
jgi:hypothetical protein